MKIGSAFKHDHGLLSFSYPIVHPFYREIWHTPCGNWYLDGPYGTLDRITRNDACKILRGEVTPNEVNRTAFLPSYPGY